MKKYLLLLCLLLQVIISRSQVICTVAGGKNIGDGSAAINALVPQPGGVVTDTAGNIYFAANTGRIRKISKLTGLVTTVAGNGDTGFSGDGGPATAASLNAGSTFNINCITIDRFNNIYLCDTYNHRVRKIFASDGIITTIAGTGVDGFGGDGGPATSAMLSNPRSIAVDSSGNIYISDGYDKMIRKIDAVTGNINIVAGLSTLSGNTGDNGPATAAKVDVSGGIAVDLAGNIFFADKNHCVIRKVTYATGIITTICGRGSAATTGDNGPATNAYINTPLSITLSSNGNIYFSVDNLIRMITVSTGIITTFAGIHPITAYNYNGDGIPASQAAFKPYGITIGHNGELYMADNYNNRIRKINLIDTIINTVAGNGTLGYLGDGMLATAASLLGPSSVQVDTAGNIYIADQNNYRIRKVTKSTGLISTIAGNGINLMTGEGTLAVNAGIGYITSIAIDSAANLYMADPQNDRVRKITNSTGIINEVAGSNSGIFGDGGPALGAELKPTYIALDKAANIYLSDDYFYRVREVTASNNIINTVAGVGGTGAYQGDGGPALAAYLSYPQTIAIDSVNNIYIADYYRIRKVTRSTGIIDRIAGNGNYGFSPDGTLATNAMLYGPAAIIINKAGDVIFTDNHLIRKITVSTGIISTIAGSTNGGYSGDSSLAINAALKGPGSLCFDKYGDMYIADNYNNSIRKITNPITSIRNGNWNDPATWSNGKIPDAFTQVTINNNVIVNINAIAYSVNITAGHTLDVSPGLHLNITGH